MAGTSMKQPERLPKALVLNELVAAREPEVSGALSGGAAHKAGRMLRHPRSPGDGACTKVTPTLPSSVNTGLQLRGLFETLEAHGLLQQSKLVARHLRRWGPVGQGPWVVCAGRKGPF